MSRLSTAERVDMERPHALGVALAREEEAAPSPDLPVAITRQVSLRRILRHDNLTFLLASFGTVLFAFSLVVWITGSAPGGRGRPSRTVTPEEALAEMAFTGALMIGLWVLAGLRAWRIRRLFGIGERVEARVEKISHAKGYTRLRLDYRHRGTPCSLRRSIRRLSLIHI